MTLFTRLTILDINEFWLHNEYDFQSEYRIYSNKRRGDHYIFRAWSAAFIRGRGLFKN